MDHSRTTANPCQPDERLSVPSCGQITSGSLHGSIFRRVHAPLLKAGAGGQNGRSNKQNPRLMSKTSRQVVTGVVVNHHLNVTRKAFDRLKAIIHACGKAEDLRLDDPVFRASLLGKIGSVEAVNPHRGQKLLELLSTAVARRNGGSYPDRGE